MSAVGERRDCRKLLLPRQSLPPARMYVLDVLGAFTFLGGSHFLSAKIDVIGPSPSRPPRPSRLPSRCVFPPERAGIGVGGVRPNNAGKDALRRFGRYAAK